MRWRPTRHVEEPGVDISPLIDMVFILLIFFMVTTTFVKDAQVELERPSAASAKAASTKAIRVTLDQRGEVYVDGRPVRPWMVQNRIREQLQGAKTARCSSSPIAASAPSSSSRWWISAAWPGRRTSRSRPTARPGERPALARACPRPPGRGGRLRRPGHARRTRRAGLDERLDVHAPQGAAGQADRPRGRPAATAPEEPGPAEAAPGHRPRSRRPARARRPQPGIGPLGHQPGGSPGAPAEVGAWARRCSATPARTSS
ncbi:MAG: biopolymer transporter ExbD [bacterium]